MLNLKGRQFQVHHKFTRDIHIQTAEKKSNKNLTAMYLWMEQRYLQDRHSMAQAIWQFNNLE